MEQGPIVNPEEVKAVMEAKSEEELVKQIEKLIESLGTSKFCPLCGSEFSKPFNRRVHMRKYCPKLNDIRTQMKGTVA